MRSLYDDDNYQDAKGIAVLETGLDVVVFTHDNRRSFKWCTLT